MPTRRVPTSITPPSRRSRDGHGRERTGVGGRQGTASGSAEKPDAFDRGHLDIALQLAIGRDGIGLELARPVRLACLLVTDLAATLPGLRFPVDVSGGVSRFRHRRGELQRMQVELPLRGLERWVAASLRGILGTRAPEVSVSTTNGAATVCVAKSTNVDEEALHAPAVLAFELHALSEGDDLVFVVERARGSELPAPAIALAIACVDAAFGNAVERAGAVFVVRRAAEALTRALLPEAGARVPASEQVRWTSLAPHGDTWILHAQRGGLEATPTEEALRAREVASMLREADEALVRENLEDARTKYVEALERAPRHPEIARRIVDIDARVGGRAEAALAMLAESRVVDVPLGTTPGELLAETGDLRGALASLERTGETDPAAALAASAFEMAARISLDPEESARWLNRAVARAPRSPSARWMRVAKRLELGRIEDALADVEHLEALARGTRARHAVWSLAGRAWRTAGLGARAGAIYERALRYVPDEPQALAGLGNSLLGEGREMRGIALLTRALELADARGEPTSSILLDLGTALADKLGDFPAAIARVRAIPMEAREAPDARGLEGRWRARLGNLAGAALAFARLRELATSLATGTDDARVESIAALLLEGAEMERSRIGDTLGAQRHLAAALRLRPHNPELRQAYREVGALIADRNPDAVDVEKPEDGSGHPRPKFAFSVEEPADEDGTKAARVEELTQRLRLSPEDDAVADELSALLETLGRGHELLALLSARMEDAPAERRVLMAPRVRAALERLAVDAESAGRAEEAALYRGAITTLVR